MGGTRDGRVRDIEARTFAFALRVVRVCQALEKKSGAGRTLGNQLLRAGTSVGANVEEAQAGQSRADFRGKYAIAPKEARETRYWPRLLQEADIMPSHLLSDMQQEIKEIMMILGAIVVRSRDKIPAKN